MSHDDKPLTPRTDRMVGTVCEFGPATHLTRMAEFARQLERELAFREMQVRDLLARPDIETMSAEQQREAAERWAGTSQRFLAPPTTAPTCGQCGAPIVMAGGLPAGCPKCDPTWP